MKLTREGIKERKTWEDMGIILPDYDVDAVSEKAIEASRWVHFGIGNIFRVFIGGIADELISKGYLDRGMTCVETFDFDVVDKIYDPYDNLGLSVILRGDGTRENRVLGSMAVLTAMLYERFKDSQTPVSLVSMDNCSQNGSLLKASVVTIANEWLDRGFVDKDFIAYIEDEKKVAFPWTMIDKITPRPSEAIADDLKAMGVEDMDVVITSKRTYIAPFINAEGPQYLVIEDSFPNGRPELEHGYGVYLADRETVNKSERMKVTACLNPVHSALGPLEVVLGIDLFADGLKDPELLKMGRTVAYGEGLPVVEDPKIISPQAFIDELFDDRFPNEYLGDTNLRLSTDVSQGVGVRFGETVKAYVRKEGTAESLVAIPLGIAGWLRYMLGVDDQGNTYELAPDPMNEELTEQFKDIVVGDPTSLKDQLKPVLSNENVFFTDLYKAGLGEKIESMFREMIAGKGATRATIHKYFG